MLIRVPESAGELYERITYPAGELQIRLPKHTIEALYAAENIQVLCRNAHQYLMELALLADAVHYEVGHIESTLVLPYLPYSRADRRFTEGDCAGLKVFGEVIDNMHFSHVRTLDVHSFRARKYVSRLQDVSARPFIARAVADIADHGGHPVVLLPDEGAKRYGLDGALQCHKKRDAVTGKLSGFEVPEFDKSEALIVDDICDGGGTFIGLAQAIQDKFYIGCHCSGLPHRCNKPDTRRKLYLYVTHGIFSKGFSELLRYFERIYTTNNLPFRPREAEQGVLYDMNPRLKVFDCLPELLKEVK